MTRRMSYTQHKKDASSDFENKNPGDANDLGKDIVLIVRIGNA